MSFYKFGIILKKRRHELGYTQEDLADGICAVNTLSRYENGERLPTKTHMEMLLQRLGYSDTIFDLYVDDRTFALHELKFNIRQAFILNQFDRAKELLGEYKNLADENSCVSQQFMILCQTTLNQEMSAEEKLSELERAIRLTCPKYDRNKLPPVFSYEEIIILNHIAVRQ